MHVTFKICTYALSELTVLKFLQKKGKKKCCAKEKKILLLSSIQACMRWTVHGHWACNVFRIAGISKWVSSSPSIRYIINGFFFFIIKASACSITVSNTTCYHSLPFLLIVFIYISFNFSKTIVLIYLSNCFKYLFVSSLLVTGHLPTFNTLLFRCALSFTSLSHWNIRWSTVFVCHACMGTLDIL